MSSTGALITDFFPKRKKGNHIYDSNKKIKNSLDTYSKSPKLPERTDIINLKKPKNLNKLLLSKENYKEPLAPLELNINPISQNNLVVNKQQSLLNTIRTNVAYLYENDKEIKDVITEEHKEEKIELHGSPVGTQNLKLPAKYYTLLDIFRCSDHIVSIYYNRNETCWFPRLKSGIEQMRRKRFTEKELSQITTVYPNAYLLSFEKIGSHGRYLNNSSSNDYKLTINPLLTPEKTGINPTKNIFNPQILIKRRAIFYQNLMGIVKNHHKKFLKSLHISLNIDDNKLTKWHPDFRLESLPDIALSKLPECAESDKINSASDAFKRINTFMSPRTQRAFRMVSGLNSNFPTSPHSLRYQAHTPHKVKCSQIQESLERTPTQLVMNKPQNSLLKSGNSISKSLNFYSKDHIITSPHLKGISPNLVNKIRDKEAAKIEIQLTKNIDEENHLQILSKLPDLVRILRNFFVSENKSAITMNNVLKKMGESHRSSTNTNNMVSCLSQLVEVVPEWIQTTKIRDESYVKIDRTMDISIISTKLDQILKEKLK